MRKRRPPRLRGYRVTWTNGTRFVIYSHSLEDARELAESLERYAKALVVDVIEWPRPKRAGA